MLLLALAAQAGEDLDRLDRAYAALGRFRAEYRISDPEAGSMSATFAADPEAGRAYVLLVLRKDGQERTIHTWAEGGTFRVWGDGPSLKYDLGRQMKEIRAALAEPEAALRGALPAGRPAPERKAMSPPDLHLDLTPRKADGEGGSLHVALVHHFGASGRFGRLRKADRLEIAREGDDVLLKLPDKTIRIARKTGVIRSIRTVDPDGTAREVLLSRLDALETFPVPEAPARFRDDPLPMRLLDLLLSGAAQDASALVGVLGPDAAAEETSRALGRWCATYLDLLRRQHVRLWIVPWIRELRAKGSTLDTLTADADPIAQGLLQKMSEAEARDGDAKKARLDYLFDLLRPETCPPELETMLKAAVQVPPPAWTRERLKAVWLEEIERER